MEEHRDISVVRHSDVVNSKSQVLSGASRDKHTNMANRVMGYMICGYNSVDNLLSEQSSPFRRWTTGGGAGSSYRHHDHINMYNKQMSEGSTPVSAGGVARWSLGLEQLLADPAGAAAFAHFLDKEFAKENIRFWWSCEQYNKCEDPDKRAELAHDIWKRHLGEPATDPVNVDASARRAAELRLGQRPPPPDLFLQAQKQIFNVMKFDSYPRFLRSAEHAACARAGLLGAPCPYEPAPPATPAKLKKTASNASDGRRRSGGLALPWRARALSRERRDVGDDAPTDVVKSNSTLGQQSLCRVLLPGGSTSVVEVREGDSIKELVDRLLQKRKLVCPTYDVILKDGDKPSGLPLDPSLPARTLRGRCCEVSRRVTLRVRVRGRGVGVRCRPERDVAHVAAQLLRRYAPGAAPHPAPHPAALPPDTKMAELDGARIQIVECHVTGTYFVLRGEGGDAADGEGGEGGQLDARLHDDAADDCVSNSSSTNRSRVGLPPSGAPHSTHGGSDTVYSGPVGPVHSKGPGISGGPIYSEGPGEGDASWGLVRAALKAGPPLHHHPPDFLDSLREKQRARLPPSPPCPARAPPPPLPPKPPRVTHHEGTNNCYR